MTKFSEWLTAARQDAVLTQQELADLADLSKPQVSRLESGNQGTRRNTAIRLANALKRPPAEALAALANDVIGDTLPLNQQRTIHHPQSDGVIRMRIQTEFQVLLPDGQVRALRPADLTPAMRLQLAEILLSGQLDDDQDVNR
jgi:transcriptional regulator with XRE-family HTH domain